MILAASNLLKTPPTHAAGIVYQIFIYPIRRQEVGHKLSLINDDTSSHVDNGSDDQ